MKFAISSAFERTLIYQCTETETTLLEFIYCLKIQLIPLLFVSDVTLLNENLQNMLVKMCIYKCGNHTYCTQ